MWTLLLLALVVPERLSQQSMPLAAHAAGPNSYWLTAAGPGQLPQLFLLDAAGSTQRINLPSTTLFVAAQGSELLLVSATRCDRYRLVKGALERGTGLALTPSLSRMHPWIFLNWERLGNQEVLAVFDQDRLLLIPAEGDKLRQVSLSQGSYEPYLNTRAFGSDKRLYWNDQSRVFSLSPNGQDPLQALQAPALANMENAVVLAFAEDAALWFIHGGKRGSLESFGWRMQGGGVNFGDKGIVTRFGSDRITQATKLILFTVPNSIGSQLWRSLSATRAFNCSQMISTKGKWARAKSFDVPLTKPSERDAPYLLSWDTDLDHDGYADLIAADDKGVRLYRSDASGFWNTSSQKLSASPDVVLFLADRILLGKRQNQTWTFQVRSAP